MKEINLQELLPPLVLRDSQELPRPPIFLTLPPFLPKLMWQDDSLEHLIRSVVDLWVGADQPGMPLRMAVSQRLHCTDLDDLLGFQPFCWIEFRIEAQSQGGSSTAMQGLPEKHGFRYSDTWQPDACHKLISYKYGTGSGTAFFLYIQMHKANGRYSLLIPIPVQAAGSG
jgi:hypothetical protein